MTRRGFFAATAAAALGIPAMEASSLTRDERTILWLENLDGFMFVSQDPNDPRRFEHENLEWVREMLLETGHEIAQLR